MLATYYIFSETFFKADDIRNEADELLRIRDYLFKELAQKTGQPVEKVIRINSFNIFNFVQLIDYSIFQSLNEFKYVVY